MNLLRENLATDEIYIGANLVIQILFGRERNDFKNQMNDEVLFF